jgi:CBS domain containing-hemolysin-like protein
MEAHQVSRMIVLDENDHLAGIISLADIASNDRSDRAGETLGEIKQP